MKIRKGFVSNSSSTSFCIYGIHVYDPADDLYEEAEELGLFVRGDQCGDGLYIGKSWTRIGDDETGKEFKESAQVIVNKLSLPDSKKVCSTIQEGWFDG